MSDETRYIQLRADMFRGMLTDIVVRDAMEQLRAAAGAYAGADLLLYTSVRVNSGERGEPGRISYHRGKWKRSRCTDAWREYLARPKWTAVETWGGWSMSDE